MNIRHEEHTLRWRQHEERVSLRNGKRASDDATRPTSRMVAEGTICWICQSMCASCLGTQSKSKQKGPMVHAKYGLFRRRGRGIAKFVVCHLRHRTDCLIRTIASIRGISGPHAGFLVGSGLVGDLGIGKTRLRNGIDRHLR